MLVTCVTKLSYVAPNNRGPYQWLFHFILKMRCQNCSWSALRQRRLTLALRTTLPQNLLPSACNHLYFALHLLRTINADSALSFVFLFNFCPYQAQFWSPPLNSRVLLSGHPAVSRGWPLNKGLTVSVVAATFVLRENANSNDEDEYNIKILLFILLGCFIILSISLVQKEL